MFAEDEKTYRLKISESIANAAERLFAAPAAGVRRGRMKRLGPVEGDFGVGVGAIGASLDGGRPGKHWLEYVAGRRAFSTVKLNKFGEKVLEVAGRSGTPLFHIKEDRGTRWLCDDAVGIVLFGALVKQIEAEKLAERRERNRLRSARRRAVVRGDNSGTVTTLK